MTQLYKTLYVVAVFVVYSCAVVVTGCGHHEAYNKNASHQDVADESIQRGEVLAKQYCQSCHILPSPSLLTPAVWANGVLPQMGPRLGIFEYRYKKYPNSRGDVHAGAGYYPSKPVVTNDEWQSIVDYYTALSPDTLPNASPGLDEKDGAALFSPLIPPTSYYSPATCFIKEDTATKSFITSDILLKKSYRFNKNLQLVDSFLPNRIITDMVFEPGVIKACNIGVFSPNNAEAGSVESIVASNNNHKSTTIIDTLVRPVSITAADINNDGKTDYITCEFGYLKGALAWNENKGNNTFVKHIIKAVPGAIKAYVNDYNHDGLQDIWVLFAQGDEGISLFTNKGNGMFEEKRVLRFPPCYGSSYFELVDINKDGHPDIVYTCGDNADFSTILKPYHGVYIYLNDGNNNFKQQYFYHINGCYKAIARDFDGDGNIDIATIAYFADYKHHPREGFIYLKNNGVFNFTPYTIQATNAGRWMAMDVADVDGDGKPDILLANASVGPTIETSVYDWKKGPPFVVLKNIMK